MDVKRSNKFVKTIKMGSVEPNSPHHRLPMILGGLLRSRLGTWETKSCLSGTADVLVKSRKEKYVSGK